MQLNELRCRNCSAPLAAENVVERLAMARCNHCNAVFALDLAGSAAAGTAAVPLRPQVSLPRGVEIQDVGSALEIRRRWFSPKAFFLLFFSIFWNGFMIFWHTMALSMGAWFMSLFGLLHTAVGIVVLYSTIAMFLNTTYIRVAKGMFQVQTKPLPWLGGNKWIETDHVSQLYCVENTHRGKNGTHYTYDVMLIREENLREPLLQGLEDLDQALYIEQEVERFLGIKDQQVSGEVRR